MQYAGSKVDYVIGEFICMLPSDMNLRIGMVKSYNNKILISSPSFKIGTNVKISLDGEKDKSDVNPKKEEIIKPKSDIKPKKEGKLNIKMMKTEPDMNKITYEEEKVALVLGIASILAVWWMFKWLIFSLSLS